LARFFGAVFRRPGWGPRRAWYLCPRDNYVLAVGWHSKRTHLDAVHVARPAHVVRKTGHLLWQHPDSPDCAHADPRRSLPSCRLIAARMVGPKPLVFDDVPRA